MGVVKFDRGLYRSGGKTAAPAYGQIELNQVWFDRAGMVEAQCALDPACFSSEPVGPLGKFYGLAVTQGFKPSQDRQEKINMNVQKIVAQNGAFLMVDKANKLATIPNKEMSDAGFPMGINYTSEVTYDDTKPQRRNFFLTTKDWLPRIGYLETGMRFTTNTISWYHNNGIGTSTDKSYEVYQKVKEELDKGSTIYGIVLNESDGEIVIFDPSESQADFKKEIKNAMGNLYFQVVKAYDNADRTCSFMFQVINKPAIEKDQD